MALNDADLPKLIELLNQIDIRFKWRRKTAAAWTASNEVLLEGEAGLETDTGKFKIGNGADGWNSLAYTPLREGAIGATFDGGGAAIPIGLLVDVPVPFDCVIKAAVLFGDPSGTLVVSVWRCLPASYPPVAGDNIAGTAPPTLSGAVYSRDSTLTGWTTTLSKGDVVRFKVQSCALVTRASLALEVLKL